MSVHCVDKLQGVERNFAHKALYYLCAEVYYGTSQKLLGNKSEFKTSIPPAAVVLVATGVCCPIFSLCPMMLILLQVKAVLRCLSNHGSVRDLGRLCGSLEVQEYERIHQLMTQVMNDETGGDILFAQLERWAKRAR